MHMGKTMKAPNSKNRQGHLPWILLSMIEIWGNNLKSIAMDE